MAQPQPILTPLTPAAIFLVVTIGEGGEQTVHDVLADLSGLERSVGFRVPASGLSCVAAIGSAAWDRLFSGPRPAELHAFVALAGPRHHAPATPGDLLFHIRASALDLCFELAVLLMDRLGGAVTSSTRCTASATSTSATCSASSTAPRTRPGRRRRSRHWSAPRIPSSPAAATSIVQKYLHDLRAWNALPVEEQERVDRPHQARRHRTARRRQARRLARRAEHDRRRRRRPSGRSCATTCRSAASAAASSAPTSSATPRRRASPSRCCENMFIGDRRATTTGSSTSPPRSPAPCSSCRPPTSSTTSRRRRRRAAAAADAGPRAEPRPTEDHASPADGSLGIGSLKGSTHPMNNLHRELAPISDGRLGRHRGGGAAHVQAARRRPPRGRRARSPDGDRLLGGRHRATWRRSSRPPRAWRPAPARPQPLVELRVPFTVDRQAIDDVERGAQDSDWQPVKDAAKQIAFAEDRAVFEGYAAAGITGIRAASSNAAARRCPTDARGYPDAVTQALSRAAAGRRRRPVLAGAGRRRVHRGQRDHRPRLSDPRAPRPARRRRDHLGARDRRRVPALHPRRRLRAAPRPGPRRSATSHTTRRACSCTSRSR